jgi:glucan phosphoethanolaminetransferase (alkaline phosphatase superfamily)
VFALWVFALWVFAFWVFASPAECCKIAPMSSTKQPRLNLSALIVTTLLNAFFYALMEWIFFVTKPSALSLLSLFEKVRILFVTGGTIALATLLVLFLLLIPSLFTRDKAQRRLAYLACLVPAFIASVTALILFDNFTYTVFRFGIVTSDGNWRIPYLIGFLLFLAWMTHRTHVRSYRRKRPASVPTFGLLAVSIIAILTVTLPASHKAPDADKSAAATQKYPNIIILGSDGLSAAYLSVYGYSKETTPFLEKLATESLMAENAFVNSSSTTGSTTSMLTGKYPMDVQVFRYPDTLTGDDSFEHLPAILKAHGYQTVEIGVSDYVDAGKLNLLDGFEIVNNRSFDEPTAKIIRSVLGNSPSTQFITTVLGRAEERLLHIFFIRDMRNPIKEVDDPNARMTDEQRVQQIKELLDRADRPLFIFAHFMDTHGPHFSSSRHVFSTGETDAEWDRGLYQDAILSFDGSVEQIYRHLEETGKLENTILVVYTDHGFMYAVNKRIPIIIRFPKQAHVGTRSNNLQVIDVPVTLLDYLGLEKPAWMSGATFLNSEVSPTREIISIIAGSPKKIKPPFFQIKSVVFIVCQKYYELNVQENKFTVTDLVGHTAPCEPQILPPQEEIRAEILDYLEQYGYDVSSLR